MFNKNDFLKEELKDKKYKVLCPPCKFKIRRFSKNGKN